MFDASESSALPMLLLLLSLLREQQSRFAHHPGMTAVVEKMRPMMAAVLDLLDDEELDELILRFPPEMDLIYPTAPYLTIRDAA